MFDGDLDITCPECKHKTPIAVREIESNPHPSLLCGGCGKTISINANDFREKLGEVRKSIDDFKKTIAEVTRKLRR